MEPIRIMSNVDEAGRTPTLAEVIHESSAKKSGLRKEKNTRLKKLREHLRVDSQSRKSSSLVRRPAEIMMLFLILIFCLSLLNLCTGKMKR